jgi:hypothetical protein
VVRLELPVEAAGTLLFAAVSLPEGTFDAVVRTPDGRPASEIGATIHVSCQAIRATSGTAPPVPAEIPIRVEVTANGYRPLVFEYRLAEGQPGTRVLVPLDGP